MGVMIAFLGGVAVYAVVRVLISGFYTVRPDQRAVLTSFGRAERLTAAEPKDPRMTADEHERYQYPRVRVIGPGGPYFKWPWQTVHRVRVSTQAVDVTWDPTKSQSTIEAVTKDNLTTGVNGQIRFRVSEENLYAYLFGVASPLEHVMGYFVSVLRERIANFVDPKGASLVTAALGDGEPSSTAVELSEGVSINESVLGLASFTTIFFPPNSCVFNSLIAVSASDLSFISTNPNPFESPLNISRIIFTLFNSPYCLK